MALPVGNETLLTQTRRQPPSNDASDSLEPILNYVTEHPISFIFQGKINDSQTELATVRERALTLVKTIPFESAKLVKDYFLTMLSELKLTATKPRASKMTHLKNAGTALNQLVRNILRMIPVVGIFITYIFDAVEFGICKLAEKVSSCFNRAATSEESGEE